MKIRANKRMHRYIITIMSLLAVFCVYIPLAGKPVFLLVLDLFAIVPLIIYTLSMGRSTLCVLRLDDEAVAAKFLGRTIGRLRWDEMAEVGIGTEGVGRKSRYYIYFVRYPLNEIQRHMIPRMMQNDSALWMDLTKKSLEAVNKYYTGPIHQLELML